MFSFSSFNSFSTELFASEYSKSPIAKAAANPTGTDSSFSNRFTFGIRLVCLVAAITSIALALINGFSSAKACWIIRMASDTGSSTERASKGA